MCMLFQTLSKFEFTSLHVYFGKHLHPCCGLEAKFRLADFDAREVPAQLAGDEQSIPHPRAHSRPSRWLPRARRHVTCCAVVCPRDSPADGARRVLLFCFRPSPSSLPRRAGRELSKCTLFLALWYVKWFHPGVGWLESLTLNHGGYTHLQR